MPGYGRSKHLEPMHFQSLAESVIQILDREKIEKINLVGHSFGGMIALETAIRFPQRLTTLTLSGTNAAFGNPSGEWQSQFIKERLGPLREGAGMRSLAESLILKMIGPNAPIEARDRFIESMAKLSASSYEAYLKLLVQFDRRRELSSMMVKTLVLSGEADRVALPKTMRAMANQIPQATFKSLPDVGHLGNLESPEAFNQALFHFLVGVDETR
jgi:3-oxoadipate enol-lactonase